MGTADELTWKVDECAAYHGRLHLRGWCFHPTSPVQNVSIQFEGSDIRYGLQQYGQPSPDVAAAVDPRATHARIDEWISVEDRLLGHPFSLHVELANGTTLLCADGLTNCAHGDPYFQSWENFIAMLESFKSGTVLEIGSRARSAITRRHRIPSHLGYVGMDILPGPNVDIVGDAHELSNVLRGQKFVAAFSTSVFEHLAMPWKVAIELNRVLEPGGIVYTSSHQTWPMHEEPWDFWRFSQYSWRTLFNAATGFEVVEAVVGDPCRVHACRTSRVTRTLPGNVAYLGSSSIVRKTSDTTLSWPVSVDVAAASMYPAGELQAPPTPERP